MATRKKTPSNPLDRALAKFTEKHQTQKSVDLASMELLDFMVAASPHLRKPHHLEAVLPYLYATEKTPQVFAFSAPPRHGKSVLVNHYVAWMMIRHPGIKIAYGCYGEKLSLFFSDEVKDILTANGYEVDRSRNSRNEWRLMNGSLFKAVSPGSDFTGRGADIIIIDDPYKNRVTASSGAVRESTWNWFTGVAITRRSPNCSVIVTHCIAKDEPVLMADGSWRSVQDVRQGERVRAFENGEFVNRLVLGSKLSGRDPILRVSTARKSIRVNDRHPFLLESGEWRKAGELKAGDRVVVTDTGVGTEGCDPEYAWFLGFMLGDGWVTEWKRKGRNARTWCVCVAKSEYPELNERVQMCFERFLGRRPKDTPHGYYRLDSCPGGRLIQQAGVTGGAWKKRIPEWVYRLTPELKIAFLRGYADADGHVQKRCHDAVVIGSVSEALIEDTRRLAVSAGVTAGVVCSSTQQVRAPHSAAPKLSTIFKVHLNFARAPERIETITEIRSDGEDDVFDLMVDGAENFIAGGFVVHNTRWNIEDIIGVMANKLGYPYINLPALDDDGGALWPDEWSVDRLKETRSIIGEYDWASLYMGQPRPLGGAVFHDYATYTDAEFDKLLEDRKLVKYLIGIDCAYTKKAHADYSVAVVLAQMSNGKTYLVDVRRAQCSSTEFSKILKELRTIYDNAPIYWYTGGQEKVVAEFFRNTCGVPVKDVPAKEDKFARAQSVAAAWNAGRILLPEDTRKWMNDFLPEVLAFTGLDDPHDDQVDALAAAFIPLAKKPAVRGNSTSPTLPW